MIYLGIDPGARGAYAALSESGRPIGAWSVVGADRAEIVEHVAALAREYGGARATLEVPGRVTRVRGRAFHAVVLWGWVEWWRGVLLALGVFVLEVAPATWQTAIQDAAGDGPKARSISAARLRWPGVSLRRNPRCRTDDDGIADAYNIAEWGRNV